MKSGNINGVQYAPFVTTEKYAELAGLSIDAVKGQIKNGKLPMLKRDRKERGRNYINMHSLAKYADEQSEKHQDWKSAI